MSDMDPTTHRGNVEKIQFMDRLYRGRAYRQMFEQQTGTPPLLVGQKGFEEDRDSGRLHTYRERFWGWASARYYIPATSLGV